MDMTKYSDTYAAVANQDYIEVAHNQNSNDVSFTGWFKNTLTGLWQSIADLFTHQTDDNLDNEFNPEFTQKKKKPRLSLKKKRRWLGPRPRGAPLPPPAPPPQPPQLGKKPPQKG